GDELARVGVDRLVALDPTEPGVAVPLVAERGDEDPFQHLDPPLQAGRLLGGDARALQRGLVGEAALDERREGAGNEPDPPRARAIAEAGGAERALRAAAAFERLRREVLCDHDVRKEAREVELV